MLIHGVSPIDFCLSVIVPIPKNKRANKCDSSNYRAIAISSLLGKFVDNVVFEDQYTYLSTDVLQFGYKICSSTTICTTLLLETIAYYYKTRSDCFLLFICTRCVRNKDNNKSMLNMVYLYCLLTRQ